MIWTPRLWTPSGERDPLVRRFSERDLRAIAGGAAGAPRQPYIHAAFRSSIHTTSGGGNGSDTTYTATTNWTPAKGSFVIALVNSAGGTESAGSVTGHGLTFTSMAVTTGSPGGTGRCHEVWGALAGFSASSGAALANGWGTVRTGCSVIEFEVFGLDLSGGVAGTIVQSVPGGPTIGSPCSITLASAGHPANRSFAFWQLTNANALTGEANWTELDQNSYSNPATRCGAFWRSDVFDTTCTATFSAGTWFGIAFELKAQLHGGAVAHQGVGRAAHI